MDRFRPRSVRYRVTVLASLIMAAVLSLMAIGIVIAQHRSLTAALDAGLRQRADDLAAVAAMTVPETLAGVDDDTAAQLTTPDGRVVATSANVDATTSIGLLPADVTEVIADRSLAGPDDSFRVLSRRIGTPEGELVLHVATATDDVSDAVAALRSSMLVAVPLAVAALAGAIWFMVGRALMPVNDIRRQVDTISDTDLSRRVPVPDTGDEVEQLALTMNRMLDRLESGIERLNRFVADASHELRSPLTRMRAELEVDLAAENPDLRATHASLLDEAAAMEALVSDLLFLARSEAGHQGMTAQVVDVDDIVLAVASSLTMRPGLTVSVAGVSGGQVVGDRSQLERLINNLAENAVRHAEGSVTFELTERGDSTVLKISDDGPGIPPADRERVFERFARTDEGRSRGEGGSGLGLAIARDIVERHGGSIAIDPTYEPGACVVVELARA